MKNLSPLVRGGIKGAIWVNGIGLLGAVLLFTYITIAEGDSGSFIADIAQGGVEGLFYVLALFILPVLIYGSAIGFVVGALIGKFFGKSTNQPNLSQGT